MKFKARLTDKLRSRLAGALLAVLCGLWLRHFTVGQGLEHRSYDLALVLAPTVPVDEVEIVSMDESSQLALGQRWPLWDRSLHAALLNKLALDNCPLVVFDAIFTRPDTQAADQALAEAMRRQRCATLCWRSSGRWDATSRRRGRERSVRQTRQGLGLGTLHGWRARDAGRCWTIEERGG